MSNLYVKTQTYKCNVCGSEDTVDVDGIVMCNECGNFIELPDEDVKYSKSVEINEIYEDEEYSEDVDSLDYVIPYNNDDLSESDEHSIDYEFLEDLEELEDVLFELKEKESSSRAYEAYPGLIILGKNKNTSTNEENDEDDI